MRTAYEPYQQAPDREASRAPTSCSTGPSARRRTIPCWSGISTQIRSRVSLNLGAEPYTAQVRETAAHQHGELVEAIAAGNGDLAAAIAADHFVLTEKMIRDLVRRVRRESGAP